MIQIRRAWKVPVLDRYVDAHSGVHSMNADQVYYLTHAFFSCIRVCSKNKRSQNLSVDFKSRGSLQCHR